MPNFTTSKLFDEVLNLCRSAASNPIEAQPYVSQMLAKLTAMQPSFGRRPPVTRIVVPNQLADVLIQTDGTSNTTDDIAIYWPRRGRCLGIAGTVLQDMTAVSRVSFTLKVNGDTNLVINGNGEGYAPLSTLQNGKELGIAYFPVDWPVNVSDRWFVKFKSQLTTNPAGALLTYTPQMAFLFEEEGL